MTIWWAIGTAILVGVAWWLFRTTEAVLFALGAGVIAWVILYGEDA